MTGFNPDGSINLEIIEPYARMLSKNGISGVFVNGSTGQGLSLSVKERNYLAERWVNVTKKFGLKTIIHVGHEKHEESNKMAIFSDKVGADGIAMMVQSLNVNSIESLTKYIQTTASLVPSIPIYYYHIPSETNLYFPMIELLKDAQKRIPNFSGIKYTNASDLDDFELCKSFKNSKYEIFFGRDEHLLDGLKAGAQSAVGSTYNIVLPLYYKLIDAFNSGDLDRANNLQQISKNLCNALYETGCFRSGLKSLLKILGLDLGKVREPDTNISEAEISKLNFFLDSNGVLKYFNKV